MTKQFWGILAVIVLLLGGLFVLTNNKKASAPSAATSPTSHIFGSSSTGVKLQEYGDYQCPACGEFYVAVKQVEDKYKDQIQFQFSNLPLTQLHPNAFAAARAAEAAGKQGKYFEMHDALYQNQQAWNTSTNAETIFANYASQLGLNVTTFKADYSSAAVNDAINADVSAFKKTGEPMATPTFFLDGKKLDNSTLTDASGIPSADKFYQLIDAAIAARAKH